MVLRLLEIDSFYENLSECLESIRSLHQEEPDTDLDSLKTAGIIELLTFYNTEFY